MRPRLAALVASALLATAAHADTLEVDGKPRTYEVYVPPALATAPAAGGADVVAHAPPLVLVLHGRLGSAHQVRASSGFDEQARKYGFVAVYPDGLEHRWADARQLTLKTDKPVVGPDDVGFLLKLIDALTAKGTIDAKRVYVLGHSNGAIMTLTLACTHADRIAGIGVVAGNLPKTDCPLSRAVPAIFFQGTEDPLIPFDGGGVGRNGERGFVASADDTVKVFADKAGCGPGKKRAPIDNVKDDKTTLVLEDRAGCSVPIVRAIAIGGKHGWPGRPGVLSGTKEIDATAAMAAFFFEGKLP